MAGSISNHDAAIREVAAMRENGVDE